MRKERNMESKAKRATTGTSPKMLRSLHAIIESKPTDDVTLFQRGTPKNRQSINKFGRENRIEISSFGLLYGPGSRANYPLRFINKHQLESARRLELGDKIFIIDAEFSYRKGRVKSEVHIRNFMEITRYEKLLRTPGIEMVFNIDGKLQTFSSKSA